MRRERRARHRPPVSACRKGCRPPRFLRKAAARCRECRGRPLSVSASAPFGKPGHFLQAATYAFVFECNRFDVFYYFTNTINTAWVRIRYKMTEKLKDMLFGALVFCNERLDIIVNRQTCPYPIPRATERKKNAIKVMEECFLFTTQLVECEPSLDEEPSNQGENNGP